MQVASVAFWAKSVFTYKPATKMVKEIHNQVLRGYASNLANGASEDFNKFRTKFNNDKQLVRFYFRYLKQGLDPAQVSDVLVEIYQMGAGAKIFSVDPAQMSVCINGHTFTMEFLMCIKSCNRQIVFNILSNLNDEETEIFNKLRSQIQDDIALFYLIAEISKEHKLKPEESAKGLIDFWREMEKRKGSTKSPLTIKLNKDGSITIGNGHTFTLSEIVKISNDNFILLVIEKLLKLDNEDAMRFNHVRLYYDDDYELFKWIADADKMNDLDIVEALLELKSNELEDLDIFNVAVINENSLDACGIMSVNDVNFSVFFLAQMEPKLLNETLLMVRDAEIVDGKLLKFHERINHYRISSEFDRRTAKNWFDGLTQKYTRITTRFGNFKPFELTNLHHMKSILNRFNEKSQQILFDFVFTLSPKNIDEFINICDFICFWINITMEKFSIEQFKSEKVKEGDLKIKSWRGELNLFNST